MRLAKLPQDHYHALYGLRPARRGATAVEFAVVIPVFLFLIFGIAEIGRAYMVTHLLNNAARNGCRTGILSSKANTDITSAVDSALSGKVSGYTTTVKVNGTVANASTAASGDELTVTVSVSASKVTWLPVAKFLTGSLTGSYALRRE